MTRSSLARLALGALVTTGLLAMGGAAPNAASAQDAPCPDPGPLYALRGNRDAIVRLLALPRPRRLRPSEREVDLVGYGDPRWEADVEHVWGPAGRHCHVAVVRAELLQGTASEDGNEDLTLESHLVPIELAREPGAPRFVRGPEIAGRDWLVDSDPEVGDLDGDGVPDRLVDVGRGPRVASCWGKSGFEDCFCIVPEEVHAQLGREAGAVAFAWEGAFLDAATRARADSLVRARAFEDPCPAWKPRWIHWKPIGHPRVTRVEGGLVVELVVDRRECEGYLEDDDDTDFTPCELPTRIVVRHVIRGTHVETTERPFAPTSVVADADTRIVAIPWHHFDGDTRVHALPVTIRAGEGGRARKTSTGARGVALVPGFYLVEVTRGRARVTYQVTITPGDPTIQLAAPVEVPR